MTFGKKVFWGFILILIGGLAMTYSLQFDDYDALLATRTARNYLPMSPAIVVYFITTLFFVTKIFPLEKVKKYPPKKKILICFTFAILYIFATFVVIITTLLLEVFILLKFK